MSRRRSAEQRQVLPDPKYKNLLVSKFINNLIRDGKKSVAEGILYGAFEIIASKLKEDPLEVFQTAIENVKPIMEVRSRRVGGSTYQIPVEVRHSRSQALAIRWVIQNSNKRHGKSMRAKLAEELIDAFQKKGASIKKKEDTLKMAEANRAFSHYRW